MSKVPVWVWTSLLFVGSIVAFFFPVFWGAVLLPASSDLVEYYYPAFIFLSNALLAGQSFLWTPDLFSGFPLYLSQVAGFFDPINWVLNSVLTPPWSVELRIMLDMLLTMVCAYAAARSLGLSRLWASLVGPSYLLAFDWLYLSNPLTANSLFVLPLLLYCLTELTKHDRIRWRFVLLAGFGYGWAILCGYTQVVLYAALLGGVYLLAYLLISRAAWRRIVRLFATYLLVGGLGVLIGLPQILPAFKFISYSPRAQTASYQEATLKVIAPGDAITTLVPPSFYVPYVTAGRKPMYVGPLFMFMGVGALLVLGGALYRRRKQMDEMRQRMAAVGVTFLFAFIAAVQYSPLYWLLNKLPLFSTFRFPFRFMFLGAFLLALLGAYGLQHVEDVRAARWRRVAMYVLGVPASLFVLGVTFVNLLSEQAASRLAMFLASIFSRTLQGHFGFEKDAGAYARAFEQGIGAYRELLSLATLGVLLPVLALVATLVVGYLYMRQSISLRSFHYGAVLVVLGSILATGVAGWTSFAPMSSYGGTSPFKAHMSDLGQYRTYSFLVGDAASDAIPPQYKLSPQERAAVRELMFAGEFPNKNMYHDIPSVDGYDQFEPKATLEKMMLLGSELGGGGAAAGTREERVALLLSHLDLLGMMGGKYIISGVPLRHPSVSLVATSSVTSYDMILYLYKNAKAYPAYFLAAPNCTTCAPAGGRLILLRTENGLYEFSAVSAAARTLVLSQTNLPGWYAAVDGVEVPLRLVNDLYLGVDVPAGEHTVHFEYRGILGELSVLRALGIVRK